VPTKKKNRGPEVGHEIQEKNEKGNDGKELSGREFASQQGRETRKGGQLAKKKRWEHLETLAKKRDSKKKSSKKWGEESKRPSSEKWQWSIRRNTKNRHPGKGGTERGKNLGR